MATTRSDKALRKFRFERRVGRAVMNPVVNALIRHAAHQKSPPQGVRQYDRRTQQNSSRTTSVEIALTAQKCE
jgi:phage-related protein